MDLLPCTPLFRPPWFSLCCPLSVLALLCCMSPVLPSNAALVPLSDNVNETERLSLLAFKDRLRDPTGALMSWNDSLHYCRWRGVRCGRRHAERVTALNLSSLSLSGYISPSITNLTFLSMVDLNNNQLYGIIPPQLGALRRLRYLNLSRNILGGEIPSNLSRCSALQIISLRKNKLVGEIPIALGNLPKLSSLSIQSNQMTGAIPPSLGNLSSNLLQVLALDDNILTGGIPSMLGRLTNLKFFGVSVNKLSGTVPSSLYNLSNAELFSVSDNQLSGTLPLDIGITLPKVIYLGMAWNLFEGGIPNSLSNASSLREISLQRNRLGGTIPENLGSLRELELFIISSNILEAREPKDWNFLTSLTNCTHLRSINIANNRLGGALPSSMANISAGLQRLMVSGNKISGSVPPGIENLRSLTHLGLGTNQFHGSIPSTLGKLSNLVGFELRANQLSGKIPSEFGNLTLLSELYLNDNNLSGSIPPSFGRCQHLQKLDISVNRLNGNIPDELFTLFGLLRLDLYNNRLEGSLPSNIGHLINLQYLDLSVNRLSGHLPTAIGDCQSIEELYLYGNSFEGTIPPSLKNLRGAEVIDLSLNNLTGSIPEFLEDLRFLQYLNLSFNNFIGEVPKNGVFTNASAISLLGNQMICGGIPALQLPACVSHVEKERSGSHSLKIIVSTVIAGLCLLLFLCFITYCYLMRRSKRKTSIASSSEIKYKKISYHDLVKATDGFSHQSLIGRGSFGSVYKGVLDGEQMVAIKVLNIQRQGASKSFKSECEALRNIRHRNLVKIISVCSSIDSSGNDFKAIVFEFFSNGSLEKWLHLEPEVEMRTLDFAQRLCIAADVASALDYLHNHCHSPIVHCDLKPSNVLLDGNMTAHVGDFGLARFILRTLRENLENQSSTTIGIKGSIGYIAPEYGFGSPVSTYGDIYSFGILLLELFTARRPIDSMFKDGFSLQKFVEMALPEQAMDVIDPRLILLNDEDNEAEQLQNAQNNSDSLRQRLKECFVSLMRIGLNCTKESPRDRMTMGVVVKEIHLIQEVYLRVTRSIAS